MDTRNEPDHDADGGDTGGDGGTADGDDTEGDPVLLGATGPGDR